MSRIFRTGSGSLPRLAFLPLFFCLAAALSAAGLWEKSPTVRITGRVRLVGNAPFSELLISAPEGEWYIEKKEQRKLKDLQHRTVTIEGKESVEELHFASGLSAGERHTLKKIKLIEVEEEPDGSEIR